MEFSIICSNGLSYKKLLSTSNDYIRDNYIDVLKLNKIFEVQHYMIKCFCNESVSLCVYEDHKQTNLHKYIVKKNLDCIDSIINQYFIKDIVHILNLYMY